MKSTIKGICSNFGNDPTRMMDIAKEVQSSLGYVPYEAMDIIAEATGAPRVDVESLVSFYAFLSNKPAGKVVIRVCNSIVEKHAGCDAVAAAFADSLGVKVGENTEDGRFSLTWTPCIGMSDQAPSALINGIVFTRLTPDKARQIISGLKETMNPSALVKEYGDGNNSNDLVKSMVKNNIMKAGDVVLGNMDEGAGLKAALEKNPEEIADAVKKANLRGRGGAGFPTGLKWTFAMKAPGDKRYVLCNADEGEPGTFKDRVILTERPDFVFEGMTIGGFVIGSNEGVLYLRGEYTYLRPMLEAVLEKRRQAGLLGKNILGKGFDFDIRIQMGAGAYICGEESALISSCEGKRGDPKTRPPFPVTAGYMEKPTVVNNVETFACVTRILEKGSEWFSGIGTSDSAGTKLLSISGDCGKPGIYELPFGVKIQEILDMVEAKDVQGVQVGGPSGQMIAPKDFGRTIDFNDLGTGGSFMIFNKSRDLLKVAENFMEFFEEETCGFCTPCRVGNTLIKEGLERFLNNKATVEDIQYLIDLGNTTKATSRCGLGQTSPNPVMTTIANFRELYEAKTIKPEKGFIPTFDLAEAVKDAEGIVGRKSVIAHHE